MREATPDDEKRLYSYHYKDRWDKSLAQAGMSSSLEPPQVEKELKYGKRRKNSRKTSPSRRLSEDDSAYGIFRLDFYYFIIFIVHLLTIFNVYSRFQI